MFFLLSLVLYLDILENILFNAILSRICTSLYLLPLLSTPVLSSDLSVNGTIKRTGKSISEFANAHLQ